MRLGVIKLTTLVMVMTSILEGDANCNCDPAGNYQCDAEENCVCATGYGGANCDKCAQDYKDIAPEESKTVCLHVDCDCDKDGTKSCDATKKCKCKSFYRGERCHRCSSDSIRVAGKCVCPAGAYENSNGKCIACDCNPNGLSKTCDGQGKCTCDPGFEGDKCERCKHDYENVAQPEAHVVCHYRGEEVEQWCSGGVIKDGQCVCPYDKYFEDGKCKECHCNTNGQPFNKCLDNGACECNEGYEGNECERCSDDYKNTAPDGQPVLCEESEK